MTLNGKTDITEVKLQDWMAQFSLNRGYSIYKALSQNDNMAYFRHCKEIQNIWVQSLVKLFWEGSYGFI